MFVWVLSRSWQTDLGLKRGEAQVAAQRLQTEVTEADAEAKAGGEGDRKGGGYGDRGGHGDRKGGGYGKGGYGGQVSGEECEGEVARWNDDRGFGFIKREGGDVFVHVNDLSGCEALNGFLFFRIRSRSQSSRSLTLAL